jgi:hypothetical protein
VDFRREIFAESHFKKIPDFAAGKSEILRRTTKIAQAAPAFLFLNVYYACGSGAGNERTRIGNN